MPTRQTKRKTWINGVLAHLNYGIVCICITYPYQMAASYQCALQGTGASPLSSPKIIQASDSDYPGVETRQRQGIPSLAVLPGGRIWATWYAGPSGGEDENNYVVLATSGDDGLSWDEVLVVDPDGPGPLRAFDSEIWVDPFGKLWLFFAIADDGVVTAHDGTTVELKGKDNAQTWAMVAEDGNDHNTAWSAPRHIAPGVMMCKPTVLKNGEWLFPISDWVARVNKDPEAKSAGVYVSSDGGESFKLRGAALVPVEARNFDEHMIVERRDGSLWMLVRTHPKFSDSIGESVSNDGGVTWSEVKPSAIMHVPSRFFITRLQSGSLLLVKHGRIDERLRSPPHERRDLRVFISDDDGKTWVGGLMLDDREQVSYPDGQQAEDGTIYITYDHMRRQNKAIYMAVFKEEDARAGELVSGHARLRVTISYPGQTEPADLFIENFVNGSGANTSLSAIAWEAHIGAKAMRMTENNDGALSPILSSGHFIYSRHGNTRDPWLAWTEKPPFSTIRDVATVESISVLLNNQNPEENIQIALKIDGNWFVSQEGLNNPEAKTPMLHDINVRSVGWNSLTFVPGGSLAEGAASSLPSGGAVQAIGVFNSSASGRVVRIDDLAVKIIGREEYD